MPNTATKEQVSKDLDDMSDRISNIVRTTAIALLAIGWGFLVTPNNRIQVWPWAILMAIALGFVALLFDWAQYFVGYLNSARTWNAMEQDQQLRGWNPGILYHLRTLLFYAKQAATFVGVIILLSGILPAVVRLVGH